MMCRGRGRWLSLRRLPWIVPAVVLSHALAAQGESGYWDRGDVGLGLALRALRTAPSVLFVTAHPDDEPNGLLVHLSRGRGWRVGLMTLTRGEGGQNEIGPELFEALGVLRTGEMLAVHRYDGAEQFFGRTIDFGYSFSVEETLAKWNKEKTLGEIVRVLRTFRPNLVVTMVPDGSGGGQHHQASARLAAEAFGAAGDSSRFSGQLDAGLRPWQAQKLYNYYFSNAGTADDETLKVAVGDYDELLGMSYAEFGARARNLHRSQGMNAPPVAGPRTRVLRRVRTVPAGVFPEVDEEVDLGDGLPRHLRAACSRLLPESRAPTKFAAELLAGAADLEAIAIGAMGEWRRRRSENVGPALMRGVAKIDALRAEIARDDTPACRDLDGLLARKRAAWELAAARAHRLSLHARVVEAPAGKRGAEGAGLVDGLVTPGEVLFVEATVVHQGRVPVQLVGVRLQVPVGWEVAALAGRPGTVSYNERSLWRFRVAVAEDASPTGPNWSRPDLFAARYRDAGAPERSLLPFAPPVLHAVASYHGGPNAQDNAEDAVARLRSPVTHRYHDTALGREKGFALKVVPPVAVEIRPPLAVRLAVSDTATTVEVDLRQLAFEEESVSARLQAPPGWKVKPAQHSVRDLGENESATLRFHIVPPPDVKPGRYPLRAIASAGGREYSQGYQDIDYPHIERRFLYRDATAAVQVIDMRVPPDLRVGYVMGVGDEVPAALRQLGMAVEMLDAGTLATEDLGGFDAIVTGVRAYKERSDLIANHRRLLDYVRNGGTMVVQYNKYEFLRGQYAPYSYSIARPHDRITDENAPVRVLVPEHPVFQSPNKITAADWQGWVQERGLYFFSKWDEKNFVPLLEITDPFPYNPEPKRGALMWAEYGRGVYIYTGLAFFRQLPAGVPGAYRVFTNLLSHRRRK